MKAIVRPYSELADSREIYEAKTPAFITIFIGGLVIILLAAFIWASNSSLDIVVKAPGAIRPNKQMVSVTNKVVASVEKVQVANGDHVQAGDILYTLKNESMLLDEQTIKKQLEQKHAELRTLTEFKASVTSGGTAQEMLEEGSLLMNSELTDRNQFLIQLVSIQDELAVIEQTINDDRLMLQSIEQGRNLFAEPSSYYYRYEDYRMEQEQLQLKLDNIEEQLKEALAHDNSVGQAERTYKETKLALTNLVNEMKLQLNQSLADQEAAKKQLTSKRASLYVQLNETIRSMQQEAEGLEKQLAALEINKNEYVVESPAAGTVYMNNDIVPGSLLQTGMEVMTIIPEDNSEYIVELALNNQDISEIEVGDEIKLNVLSLPAKDYGYLKATVSRISPDATVESNGLSYYAVEGSVRGTELTNDQGITGSIKSGMIVQAHVVTGKKNVLDYVLGKLDFIHS